MNTSSRNFGFVERQNRQSGVGLIEVLIALLVFTVGALGLASMQISAKRASYEATQRSIATGLARDILERMRGNPDQLASYVANDLGDTTALKTLGTNCGTTACTPSQLAAYDLYQWEQLLIGAEELLSGGSRAGGLVSPRACIVHNAGRITIAIAWLGVNSLANPTESACGESSGLYDDVASGDNLRRRLLVMSTYIGAV